MKTKGKKADQKKSSNKKDVQAVTTKPVELKTAPVLSTAPVEIATPVEVQPSEPVVPEAPARRVISNEERRRLISLAAYYRAQQAGFGKTNPVEDWLVAEREVDAQIATGDTI